MKKQLITLVKITFQIKIFKILLKNIWLTNAHIFNNKKFTLIPRDSVNN